MKRKTVLSMEQALAMPSATLRFVHLGWRVIRLEAVSPGQATPGDPNRYIGKDVAGPDRHSYYIAPNVGKEAIALDLKQEAGREALKRLIRDLDVDIFCCNTIPSRYETLGIDYDTLKAVKPDLIWAGISAMGPDFPNVAGYDPVIQAMAGLMELTGQRDGPPTLSGIPLVDLKAGDEVFAGVCLALAEKAETGLGKRIDVSMYQAISSWLITTLPLIDHNCDESEITRCGNEHRKYIPTNVYKTLDGFIYIAQGSDRQWRSFISIPKFSSLDTEMRKRNNGRLSDRVNLHRDISEIIRHHSTAELISDLERVQVPCSPILDLKEVIEADGIAQKLTYTTTPEGRRIRMQPKAVDFTNTGSEFPFSPRYGEHTESILLESGFNEKEISMLRDSNVIPHSAGA